MKFKDEPPAKTTKDKAISQCKLEANRENAKKSTGPRTTGGKEHSRFNAVRHGLTAKQLMFDEDGKQNALFELSEAIHDRVGRGDVFQELLIDTFLVDYWRQQRGLEAEASLIANCKKVCPEAAFHPTQSMALLLRYNVANRRAFYKSMELLDNFVPQPAQGALDGAESSEIGPSFSSSSEAADAPPKPSSASQLLNFPDGRSDGAAIGRGCLAPTVNPCSPIDAESVKWRNQTKTPINQKEAPGDSLPASRQAEPRLNADILTPPETLDGRQLSAGPKPEPVRKDQPDAETNPEIDPVPEAQPKPLSDPKPKAKPELDSTARFVHASRLRTAGPTTSAPGVFTSAPTDHEVSEPATTAGASTK